MKSVVDRHPQPRCQLERRIKLSLMSTKIFGKLAVNDGYLRCILQRQFVVLVECLSEKHVRRKNPKATSQVSAIPLIRTGHRDGTDIQGAAVQHPWKSLQRASVMKASDGSIASRR